MVLMVVMVDQLFLALPWGCLWFLIVVFLDDTHLLFIKKNELSDLQQIVMKH